MSVRAILTASVGCSLCLWAELLPIRSYSTASGLAGNQVNRILVDSRGFVWLCTLEGLSRFDGYRFANFGMAEGLPTGSVHALLEARSGAYLVGTARGLAEFRSGTRGLQFLVLTPGDKPEDNSVTALAESSDGRIWLGTYGGTLFELLAGHRFRRQALADPPGVREAAITDITEDRCGKLWVATDAGISVMARDGSLFGIGSADGLPSEFVNALLRAHDGSMWAGMRGGFARMRDGCLAGRPGVDRVYPPESARNALSRSALNVQSLAETEDGTLWAATGDGIIRLKSDSAGSFDRITRVQGLSDRTIYSLASDRAGNLWAGTEGAGAMMIESGGFTTYREQDGLTSARLWSVFGDRAGEVLTVAVDPRRFSVHVFDGARFHALDGPEVFSSVRGVHAWGNDSILIQSRSGEWWGATADGLCRYAASTAQGLRNKTPEKCYLPGDRVFQVFEDSKGGIWASAQRLPGPEIRLVRWDPVSRALTDFADWPRRGALVKAFAEDRQGNIWLGLWSIGGLIRYDGRQFTRWNDGVPRGTIYSLFTDSHGRLWIAADGGLGVIENPAAAPVRIRLYDQSSGLASNSVRAVLEDRAGYVYAASGAGIDRLDPKNGHVKHFSAADGVALGQMESAFQDRDGNLWFATAQGLSRLTPSAAKAPLRPAVLITGVEAGGTRLAISQRGETVISGVELDSTRNQLQVEFVALNGEPEANLRYAYKLEHGDADWSPPGAQNTVNFAALDAGKYRFLVKAVDSDGVESATPASVTFRVLPPFWRRWWFESLSAAAVILVVYLLHRYRLAQMVAIERMRTSIATDLHDDIGSSLSQIAVLSEVARAGVGGENRRTQESLQKVAVLAREMVDSMSDIVWSIQAAPEGLDSLAARMREFALDLLAGQGIAFQLRSQPGLDGAPHLSLQARRHLFLMFKECIHNIARHSGGTSAWADLKVVEREIVLTIEDNGQGWGPVEERVERSGGHGFPGMRRRAESLGGSLEVASTPGAGCRVRIRIPARRSALARYMG